MDKNQIPQEWETEVVINIHKKGRTVNTKITEELPYCAQPTNYIPPPPKKSQLKKMAERECGCWKGCSCVDAVFTVQQIIEKREHNLPLLLLFEHYEKAYNKVNRDILWKIMENKFSNSLLKTKNVFIGIWKLILNLMMTQYLHQSN